MKLFVSALIALNIVLIRAAPQNNAEVSRVAASEVAVAEKKGASGALFDNLGYMSDDAMVKTCVSDKSCEYMTYGQAKVLAPESISAVAAAKGESAVSRALSPTLAEMMASLEKLKAQKDMLESLGRNLEVLSAASSKGQQLAEATKGQYAEVMSRGLSFGDKGANEPVEPGFPSKGAFAAAPLSKGVQMPSFDKGVQMPSFDKGFQAPPPPSKGAAFAMPPSKGASSAASSMQLEAMMCPMTMYELKKTTKLAGEMKMQMEASTSLNAQLMAEKQRLEASLAASEMMRMKAQEQAAFNAKVAAEEKARADAVTNALAISNTEKEMVKTQKAMLEQELGSTQQALSEEKAKNDQLTADLSQCNEEKAALNASLAEQTARAERAEQELADTKARLEEETEARIDCEETLTFTQNRLNKSESDLKNEREAREQTEKELMDTMTQLASCQREVRVTSDILNRTQDELQVTTAALAREEAAREALQTKLDSTLEELRSTEQELRDTQRALEDEQNAHAKTQRQLSETQQELEATEEARKALEEAKQNLEDELSETKSQLEAMTAERDQLQTTLDATSAALAETTAQKMKCDNDFAEQKSIAEQLGQQLGEALMMLKMEKEAREQLTETIAMVQATSMKVQEEVKKLQEENVLLQAQVEKLKKEQESALALAAGCPPTYEKFGTSCYKYVREKTQWKMAQEQCMKDMGNLVSLENTEEQIFVTNYLKRHGADDAYAFTSGNKQFNGWKWLGAENNHVGASGQEFWYNDATKMKAGYDCQAMYLYDAMQYGKWVGLPCYTAAPFVCEYNLLPPGAPEPNNPAEKMAILQMAQEAPHYLSSLARY